MTSLKVGQSVSLFLFVIGAASVQGKSTWALPPRDKSSRGVQRQPFGLETTRHGALLTQSVTIGDGHLGKDGRLASATWASSSADHPSRISSPPRPPPTPKSAQVMTPHGSTKTGQAGVLEAENSAEQESKKSTPALPNFVTATRGISRPAQR